MPESPADAVQDLLGVPGQVRRAFGPQVAEVQLVDGRVVVVKRAQGPGGTETEAASLRWLAAAEAVAVPRVHAVNARWLVIDRIEIGRPGAPGEFGAALARMHAAGAPAFGSQPPGAAETAWIGNAELPVAEGDSWPEWYAEYRVRHYLRQAVDAGQLDHAEAGVIERACAYAAELPGADESPARLHGDLWNGNVLWDRSGTPWLIDPAAHGGHRETDLAMLALFGCPGMDEIVAGYQRQWPLAPGWQARVGLHQLFPLLVHAVLFGGGYAARACAAARQTLRG